MILPGLKADPEAPHEQTEGCCQELGHKESISKFFYELTQGTCFLSQVKSKQLLFLSWGWGAWSPR